MHELEERDLKAVNWPGSRATSDRRPPEPRGMDNSIAHIASVPARGFDRHRYVRPPVSIIRGKQAGMTGSNPEDAEHTHRKAAESSGDPSENEAEGGSLPVEGPGGGSKSTHEPDGDQAGGSTSGTFWIVLILTIVGIFLLVFVGRLVGIF